MKTFYTVLFIVLIYNLNPKSALAQVDDKKVQFPYLYATYSFILPGGDLASEYGFASDIGVGVGIKTSNNWMLSAEGTYLFGSEVKQNPLEGLLNTDLQITNMYGELGQISIRLAGFQAKVNLGKIFPLDRSNQNSGIFIRGSLGLLQHQIYIETNGNNVPQVNGDYRKGYDRLCNGLLISEFAGWQNFDDNGAFHFFVGFEFSQAFTENRRSWDFATNQKIAEQRLDLVYALKLGWYIPFRQRQSTQYFYY
jgi:hypothetical protein